MDLDADAGPVSLDHQPPPVAVDAAAAVRRPSTTTLKSARSQELERRIDRALIHRLALTDEAQQLKFNLQSTQTELMRILVNTKYFMLVVLVICSCLAMTFGSLRNSPNIRHLSDNSTSMDEATTFASPLTVFNGTWSAIIDTYSAFSSVIISLQRNNTHAFAVLRRARTFLFSLNKLKDSLIC